MKRRPYRDAHPPSHGGFCSLGMFHEIPCVVNGGTPLGLSGGCDLNADTRHSDPVRGFRVQGLEELAVFGEAADALRQHSIAEGGFIAPGQGSSHQRFRREEDERRHVGHRPGPQEARSAARPWQGRRASAAEACAAAHPVQRGLSEVLGLEELFGYHRDARWLGHSSSATLLAVPVGLFRSLPYRAVLVLEVPCVWPRWLAGPELGYVPFIRAWAVWSDGVMIRAHHEYPDHSLCACQPDQWRLGHNSIEDYVGFGVCWIAKALHSQLLGRWPGLQHYPAAVRVGRDRPDEFCGCGSARKYAQCCMASDAKRSAMSRALETWRGRADYLVELRRRGLSPTCPFGFAARTP